MNLKQAMKDVLNNKEINSMSRSFDAIGDIAIIEIPKKLVKKEKLIAKKLLEMHKNINTVAKKKGAHKGVFRLQKIKILAGEEKKETIHVENAVKLKLNVETVYFSPRQATERKRIAALIKKNERVLVMFSGCGPYCFVIAKNSPAKEIIGIEKNPVAHKYALGNIKLNKINNAHFFHGDVKKIIPKLKEKFSRIIMPLPKDASKFLPLAFKAASRNCTIHLYDYLPEKAIPQKATKKVEKACKKAKKRCKILNVIKCGQLAPRKYRVCVDFKVS